MVKWYLSVKTKIIVCSVCPGIGVGWEDVDGKVGVTLELCAGIVDKDLSLEDTAVAEVLEEKTISPKK